MRGPRTAARARRATGLLVCLVLTAGPAATVAARTPAEPTAEPTPAPAATAAPGTPTDPTAVQGSGTPSAAPRLGSGVYGDIIREPETLWYAVEALPGQEVAATVVVRGLADGPRTDRGELTAAILDGQRQRSGEPATAPFTGTSDARVDVAGDTLTSVSGEHAYLAVTLASPSGANDLADVGYELNLSVAVGGTPSPADTAPAPRATAAAETEEEAAPPALTAPPPARGGGGASALFPVVLFAFALGGVTGFEATRSRARRSR